MAKQSKSPAIALGFLTAVDHRDHGLFGGYLIVSDTSRPVEFHCTVPVKTNRAQEILYGASLREYLLGEQIAPALLSKAKTDVAAICTDVREMQLPSFNPDLLPGNLSKRTPEIVHVQLPAGVSESLAETEEPASSPTLRIDRSHHGGPRNNTPDIEPYGHASHFHLGSYQACFAEASSAVSSAANAVLGQQQRVIEDCLKSFAQRFDMAEPFARVREAIEEAHKSGT